MPEPTYADYLALRKTDDPPPPSPQADDTRFYADSSGVLRALQSDGSDAAVGGGGGSQPGAPAVFTGSGPPTAPINTYFQVGPTGDPNTSGTFKLTFRGQTTAAIAFDATWDEVTAALAAISSIGAGNVASYPGTETTPVNDSVYPIFTGIFTGEAIETPTVTDDTTDHGVTAQDGTPGTAGTPSDADDGDIYFDTDGSSDSQHPGYMYLLLAGAFATPLWSPVGLPADIRTFNPVLYLRYDGTGAPAQIFALNLGDEGLKFYVYKGQLWVNGNPGRSEGADDWLAFFHEDAAEYWGIKATGHEAINATPGVPNDAIVKTSERVQYYDDTNAAPAMRYKQKTADGTLHAGISLASEGSQDTVGAAGAAADLPAKPSKYIKVTDDAGNHYVIPAYAVS